jgi:hypothetical protein
MLIASQTRFDCSTWVEMTQPFDHEEWTPRGRHMAGGVTVRSRVSALEPSALAHPKEHVQMDVVTVTVSEQSAAPNGQIPAGTTMQSNQWGDQCE